MRDIKYIIGVLALTLSVGCHNAYRSGMESLAQGNYSDAIRHAEEGLKEDPENPELNLLMAESLVAEEKWAAAEPYARQAMGSAETRGRAARVLGKTLWELGQPVDAVQVWKVAREVDVSLVGDEDYQRGLETAIEFAMSTQSYTDALAMREELARLVPDHEAVSQEWFKRTRAKIAEEYVREGKFALAAETYDALAKDYSDSSFWLEQGAVLMLFGQDSEALLAFQRYVDGGKDRLERNLEVANRAERKKNVVIALRFYDQALLELKEPSQQRAQVYLSVARLHLSGRSVDQAQKYFRNYVEELNHLRGLPIQADAYVEVSEEAARQSAPEIAITFLEEAIVKATPSWRATKFLGELYSRRARTADVERVMKLYVERSESSSMSLLTAGRWASTQRHMELAVYFLEAAVAKDAQNASMWLELSRAYAAANRQQDTQRALETYVKRASDPVRAHLDVAGIYRRMRAYEDAEKHLLAAFKQDPKNEAVVYDLEGLYRESGKSQKMHDVFKKYIVARGGTAIIYSEVANRFLRQNELDDALKYLQEAARLGQSDSWLQIADVYKRQRKERDMKVSLEKYLAAAPDRLRALDDVWQRYRTSSWANEGVPILEELIQLKPTQVTYYEELAELYFAQKRDMEAFELWKRYIESSPNSLEALEAMSRRFERQGHEEWVLTLLRELVKRDADKQPELYRLLGNAYAAAAQRRGRVSGATEALFSDEDKARDNFRLYLAKGTPSDRDLEKFADAMRHRRLWDIAALAYERLDVRNKKGGERLLHYGTALLNLGRNAEAKEVFELYATHRGRSLDSLRLISDQLMTAGLYDALEPYLLELMKSGDENLLRNAYLKLSEAYRQTDRVDKIGPLTNDYLEKTQNPGDGRRTALAVIEGAGQWKDAVKQLERISETQGEEFRMALGIMQYRAGERERAWQTFEDTASVSVTPGEAWYRVAKFFESRAEAEYAQTAYNAAVSASSQNSAILAERGRFRILRGQIEGGRQDMETARQLVDTMQRPALSKIEVEVLMEVGQHEAARQIARSMIATAFAADRDFFVKIVAAHELNSGDSVRAQRFLDELKMAGLAPDALVEVLVEHGYLEEAARAIENELQTGDPVLGGEMAVSYARVFTTLGGIERLLRVLQPVLERGGDGRIQLQLGEFLIRQGRLDLGSMFLLQASQAFGRSNYAALLGQTYLSQGHVEEAMQQFRAFLGEVGPTGMQTVAVAFEVNNREDLLLPFLSQLAAEPQFANVATTMLAVHDVQRGGIANALTRLQRVWMGAEDQSVQIDEESRELMVSAVIGAVESLAVEGYLAEARAVLESIPDGLRDSERLRDLELKLVIGDPTIGKQAVEVALSQIGDSNRDRNRRLQIAQLLMLHNRSEEAAKIATPFLTDGDFNVARQALTLLCNTAVAEGREDKIAGWVETFIANRPDKAGARNMAIDVVRVVGADDIVIKLGRESMKNTPTETHIFSNVHNALVTNNYELLKDASALMWRVGQDPAVTMVNVAEAYSDRQDPKMLDAVIEPYTSAFEAVWATRMLRIRVDYRKGDTTRAREGLLALLEDSNYDPHSVQEVMAFLESWRLWGEIAKVVAPRVDLAQMHVGVREVVGRAYLHLGDKDKALAVLDAAVMSSADPSERARALSMWLLDEGFAAESVRFAEKAIQERPMRSANYVARGLARIALGEFDGAEVDISKGLKDGHNTLLTLYRAGRMALEKGELSRADFYLDQLSRLPTADFSGLTGIELSVRAFRDAKRSKDGVRFVETRWPEIAAGRGLAGAGLVMMMANLYEDSGNQERAFALYEEAIQRALIRDPYSNDLSTFRNNLAYMFSTSNMRIDDGVALIRLAIAGDNRRNASFIDTLGWLLYRQGDLKGAEREVKRALATSSRTGGTSNLAELVELYEHLATLRSEQGYDAEGSWMRVFVDLIKAR